MKAIKLIILIFIILIVGVFSGVWIEKKYGNNLLTIIPFKNIISGKNNSTDKLPQTYSYIEGNPVREESNIIDVVEKSSPSVVTVGIQKTQKVLKNNGFNDMFDPFGFFGFYNQQPNPQIEEKKIEQDIGTGFVISDDGLIVTNKHVVSDAEATYKIISNENKEYQVEKIYRDPTLDIAILQVSNSDIKPLILGNSDELKVGQSVIAIGTALGEFRNTVTTGVVSGLGRGIIAGDNYGFSSEALDNVIQTDAAINPGNSGGPLLNSAGQVIGVNAATASGADNISFAIPINVIKAVIDNFNQTGRFERAFMGVKYKMISKDLAILNDIPEGAYIIEVVEDSPAYKAEIKNGDIITKFNNQNVNAENELSKLIQQQKTGDKISIEYWRDGEKKTTNLILGENSTQ